MSYPLERAKVIIIILFLAVCSASAQAQTGSLRGRVTDTLGAVVPNAPIMLRNLTTGLERTATTGADGTFAFAGVREGRYLLTVTASGFAPLSKEIDTIAQEIALTLEPAPLHEQTIVVSESR